MNLPSSKRDRPSPVDVQHPFSRHASGQRRCTLL